jgi:hypothetical protein
MKERPILFSAPMVRAILDERKTQTRRVLNLPAGWSMESPEGDLCTLGMITSSHPKKGKFGAFIRQEIHPGSGKFMADVAVCPYGKVGDQLWVRETFGMKVRTVVGTPHESLCYRADKDNKIYAYSASGNEIPVKWKPSIHMPRWASRINLEITDIRVERLNEISEADAIAEGIERVADNSPFCGPDCWRDYSADGLIPFDGDKPISAFCSLWESINGAGSWSANPWVWVIEFKRVAP